MVWCIFKGNEKLEKVLILLFAPPSLLFSFIASLSVIPLVPFLLPYPFFTSLFIITLFLL